MSKKKIYIIIGAVILLLIIIALVKGGSGDKVKVTVEQAKERTIIQKVTASGTIKPAALVSITSNVSGNITAIYVHNGEKVKKGKLLVKIDPKNYESAKTRSEASLNEAKANLAKAKAALAQTQANYSKTKLDYKRNKQLHSKGAISDAEWEGTEAEYQTGQSGVEASKQTIKAAEYNVESAKATLNGATDDLSKTTIYSPINGIVSTINKSEGENVVGTNMMTGTQIMSIADKSAILVYVDVNENDIVKVHKLDTAIITIDAFLGKQFKGLVTQIANDIESSAEAGGSNNNQVKNYQVVIQLLKSSYQDLMKDSTQDNPFKSGMSAYAEIITKTNNNVLSIPIQAVTTRKDSSKESSTGNEDIECVFIDSSGYAKQVNVETGIQDTRYIQIKTGLQDSSKVITGPYTVVATRLDNGTRIEKVKEEALYKAK